MPFLRRHPTSDDARALIDAVGFWWHSIDVGNGLVTPGANSASFLDSEWDRLQVPKLDGKTVLDIGAWDGYFSFRAEAAGASRVVALDHYVWSLDLAAQQLYWKRCAEEGVTPKPYHETDLWRPREMPGKAGFDTAKRILRSGVGSVAEDFMAIDTDKLGSFDVVFYLGVLYHIEDPFEALRRVARVTDEVAIISTQAIAIPGHDEHAFWEFFPGSELNNDVSNWWAPTMAGLSGMCQAAGFSQVETIAGPPIPATTAPLERYRAVVQAFR